MKVIVSVTVSLFFFALALCYTGAAFAGGQSVGKKVVELINKVRRSGAQCGHRYHKPVKPLLWNDKLGEVSRSHSADMAGRRDLGHVGADGSSLGVRIRRAGYRWVACGENLGEGYLMPEDVVKAWLKSKDHCENIMAPDFREAGAAVAKSKERSYWTVVLASPEPASRSGR